MENSLIKDIGRSYIVSSLLPAALFVSFGMLVFREFIPTIFIQRVIAQDTYYGSQWFLFIVLIVWVAFCLYSASDWTVRVYEGYYIPKILKKLLKKSLKRWQKKKTKKIKRAMRYKAQYPDDIQGYRATYYDDAKTQYENIERIMPISSNLVMPTRFGNILLTSELYPKEKYEINSIALWTRLIHVIPIQFKEILEEKNNHLIFLLNSSLMAYIIGFVSFLIGLLGLPCEIFKGAQLCDAILHEQSKFFAPGLARLSSQNYLVFGILFLIMGYVIYRVALPAAEAFGLLVRSAFDLYRFDLLRQMNYPIPGTIEKEKDIWRKISDYLIADTKITSRKTGFLFPYFVRKSLLDGRKIRDTNKN